MDGPIGKRWPAYAHWIDDGTNMFGNVDNTWVNNVVIDSPNTQDQACHNIFIPLDYTGPAANAGLATTEAIRVKAKDFGTVVSRTAGQFLCWAHVRAGSPVTVSAGGENFKLEPNGKPGEMVWMKAGNVMLPAGYTAVSAPKDDVDEIVLVNNPEWSPERK